MSDLYLIDQEIILRNLNNEDNIKNWLPTIETGRN
jgi:hypothetical protein